MMPYLETEYECVTTASSASQIRVLRVLFFALQDSADNDYHIDDRYYEEIEIQIGFAMNNAIDSNKNNGILRESYSKCDVVRAAILRLGELFCEFNDSKTSKNSSNLSYKEHENESIDANKFVKFLEDKFSLYGYSTKEINQLFIYLKAQTPNTIKLNDNNVLTVHFEEFNVIIHQFYTTKFIDKIFYQKHDIHQLLLHSIKSKLLSIRNKLNNNSYVSPNIHAQTPSLELLHSPIDMNDLLFKHKMEQQQQFLLSKPLPHKMTHSHTSSFNASSKDSPTFNDMTISGEPMFEDNDITNDMLLNVIDTPGSNNESETYGEHDRESDNDVSDTHDAESDTDSDEKDYDIDDIMKGIENKMHDQMNLGFKVNVHDGNVFDDLVTTMAAQLILDKKVITIVKNCKNGSGRNDTRPQIRIFI